MKIHVEVKNSGQEQGTALTLTTKTYKMLYFFCLKKKVSYTIACENFIMKLGEEDAKYSLLLKWPARRLGENL